MQIADITLVYKEEEKQAFADEYEARNKREDKEHELFLLEREWNSHMKQTHIDIVSPIAFTALGLLIWAISIWFIKQPLGAIFPMVTSTPIFATAILVLGIVFWVRYAKQKKDFREKDKELDEKRAKAFEEYQILKEDHLQKVKIVENIVYRKTIERREEDERLMNDHAFEALFEEKK